MEKKITITYEVSRDSIQAAAFMFGITVSEELWTKMSQEPLAITDDMMADDKGRQCKLAFALLAMEIASKK